MASTVYTGYAGDVWRGLYAGLIVYESKLSSALNTSGSGVAVPTSSELASYTSSMFASLINGINAIDANDLFQAWSSETANLRAIQALPLSLDFLTARYFNNRVTAYENATPALQAIIPQKPFGAGTLIVSGGVIVPDPGLLEFFSTFDFETEPPSLSGFVLTRAFHCAQSMLNVANAIAALQGNELTQLYDVAYRQYQASQFVYERLSSFTSGPFATDVDTVNTWNQVVALPSMTICSDILNGAPITQQQQQSAVLRNVMLTTLQNVAVFGLTLDQPTATQINQTVLRNNETLLDVAARTLGDVSLWPQIATLNGLMPPYVGQFSSPGIAGWGSNLILPTPGASVAAAGTPPSYEINFLGRDLYLGPINGNMPAWTGDFQTVEGYNNYRGALGRRLQTTLGRLNYHTDYGSRIPPEVGAVQQTESAGHITAYGVSALMSDPRTATVTNAMTVSSGVAQLDFSATVQPKGFQGTATQLNEVLRVA